VSTESEDHAAVNCWEFKKCGRQPGGNKVAELGVCRAAVESRCDGMNQGQNAGRVCWLVAGTLCGGAIQGSFAHKLSSCQECKFYQQVREEEGAKLRPESEVLMSVSDPGEIVHAYDELRRMYRTLKETQAQLTEARKLEAVGRLAAGLAHEINTPAQYIQGNLNFLQESFGTLLKAVEMSSRLLDAAKATADAMHELPGNGTDKDEVDYLCQNIPGAINESLEGVQRVIQIVRAMKGFATADNTCSNLKDIHPLIRNAITVARNDWKDVADVVTDFDPNLPPVPCYHNEFGQVILNLILNAAQATAAVVKDGAKGKGTITVGTRRRGGCAEIRISDTGPGIPKEIQSRIFEPFFTTKAIGKGTGQGLFFAYSSIVKKHGGRLHFETQPGQGTTFIVELPLTFVQPDKNPATA
jgi:signal transduction histidine kinase